MEQKRMLFFSHLNVRVYKHVFMELMSTPAARCFYLNGIQTSKKRIKKNIST